MGLVPDFLEDAFDVATGAVGDGWDWLEDQASDGWEWLATGVAKAWAWMRESISDTLSDPEWWRGLVVALGICVVEVWAGPAAGVVAHYGADAAGLVECVGYCGGCREALTDQALVVVDEFERRVKHELGVPEGVSISELPAQARQYITEKSLQIGEQIVLAGLDDRILSTLAGDHDPPGGDPARLQTLDRVLQEGGRSLALTALAAAGGAGYASRLGRDRAAVADAILLAGDWRPATIGEVREGRLLGYMSRPADGVALFAGRISEDRRRVIEQITAQHSAGAAMPVRVGALPLIAGENLPFAPLFRPNWAALRTTAKRGPSNLPTVMAVAAAGGAFWLWRRA